MVQKAKNSAWDSSDNIYVGTVADLVALPEKAREGVVILSGHTSIGDGGGGMFVYRASVPRSNHNNGTIIDPTGTGTGNGCWIRVYSLNTGSLAWFGSNDSTVNNLLSDYGIEGLIVSITSGTYAGTFQFKTAEIANHDAVNNFNGWVRLNDVNFTQNLKMNGHKITGCARAQGNNDVPNLEQVVELVQTGDYIGIVPIYADRVEGDGVTTVYITPASEQVTPPPVNLISGPSFEVTVDGIKKRHVIDFTINIDDQDPDYGKLTWEPGSIPQVGEQVDIVWFAPIIVDALLGSVVTATESAVAHTLEEWFGEYGADIIVKATGTTGFRSLGDRFADVPAYFDNIAGMIAGYALYTPGMLAIVKGTSTAGDGFIGTYFIKTQAQADIDGDDYTSPGTFNVLIDPPGWVAVFQKNEPHILQSEEQTLASGQLEVVFANEVDYAYLHLHGDYVDDARLIKGIDYTVDTDRKTVTLMESCPAGTILMANWYEPEISQLDVLLSEKEDSLGNPAENGQVLSSTTGGVRSWVNIGDAADVASLVEANYRLLAVDVSAGNVTLAEATPFAGIIATGSGTPGPILISINDSLYGELPMLIGIRNNSNEIIRVCWASNPSSYAEVAAGGEVTIGSLVEVSGTKYVTDMFSGLGGGNILASGSATGAVTRVAGGNYTDSTLAARYTRIDDIVTVIGKFTTDTTSTGVTQLSFYLDLPVASNFGGSTSAAGIANAANNTIFGVGSISADPSTDKAVLFIQLASAPGNSQTIHVYFSFSYTVT